MKIFLSWSGDQSKKLAQVLKEWLPKVIQAVKPYFSPSDIEKGARWNNEISKELEQASVGIICLTRTNLEAPWLMFEAGALAKSIEKSRVIPLLFGIDSTSLRGPLLQFQAATFSQDDIKRLVKTINSALAEQALDQQTLESVFDKWWSDLETRVQAITNALDEQQAPETRTDRELMEEILELSRAQFYGLGVKGVKADPTLIQPTDSLGLSRRTIDMLHAESIYYVGDLIQRSEEELLNVPNLGKRVLGEIKKALAARDLSLGTRLETWPIASSENER